MCVVGDNDRAGIYVEGNIYMAQRVLGFKYLNLFHRADVENVTSSFLSEILLTCIMVFCYCALLVYIWLHIVPTNESYPALCCQYFDIHIKCSIHMVMMLIQWGIYEQIIP